MPESRRQKLDENANGEREGQAFSGKHCAVAITAEDIAQVM